MIVGRSAFALPHSFLVLSISSFLFSPVIAHREFYIKYWIWLPYLIFLVLLNTDSSMFLFVFYIAQKLPHQESYGAIKKKLSSSSIQNDLLKAGKSGLLLPHFGLLCINKYSIQAVWSQFLFLLLQNWSRSNPFSPFSCGVANILAKGIL